MSIDYKSLNTWFKCRYLHVSILIHKVNPSPKFTEKLGHTVSLDLTNIILNWFCEFLFLFLKDIPKSHFSDYQKKNLQQSWICSSIKLIALHSCGKNAFSLKWPFWCEFQKQTYTSLHVFYHANENMFFESSL